MAPTHQHAYRADPAALIGVGIDSWFGFPTTHPEPVKGARILRKQSIGCEVDESLLPLRCLWIAVVFRDLHLALYFINWMRSSAFVALLPGDFQSASPSSIITFNDGELPIS